MKGKESKKSPKRKPQESVTEFDVLKKHYKFIREDSDSEPQSNTPKNKKEAYGQKLAKKYEDKLFREYGIIDLSRYQSGQIGCRWRTKKEVLGGKGESYCGELSCDSKSVNKFEMNFNYCEEQTNKNALIKVSVCKDCGWKLNFKKLLKEAT